MKCSVSCHALGESVASPTCLLKTRLSLQNTLQPFLWRGHSLNANSVPKSQWNVQRVLGLGTWRWWSLRAVSFVLKEFGLCTSHKQMSPFCAVFASSDCIPFTTTASSELTWTLLMKTMWSPTEIREFTERFPDCDLWFFLWKNLYIIRFDSTDSVPGVMTDSDEVGCFWRRNINTLKCVCQNTAKWCFLFCKLQSGISGMPTVFWGNELKKLIEVKRLIAQSEFKSNLENIIILSD